MSSVQQILASLISSGSPPPASWQTLSFEDFDGVTAPAVPASISGQCGPNIATSSTNPQTSPNCAISATANYTSEYAYFASTDGHSGEARTTCDVRLDSVGTGYAEARALVRAQTAGADADGYLFDANIYGGGAVLLVYKRVSASSILLSGTFTLASDEYYRITIEAIGTTVTSRCQRLSDGFWLQTNNSFDTGAADYFTITDSDISGAGYQGFQIYREPGSPEVSVDNLRAEAYF